MTPERWQRLQDLFHAMLELPPETRAASLSATCGDDIELRVELERLLQADARASAFVSGTTAKIERVPTRAEPEGAHIGASQCPRDRPRQHDDGSDSSPFRR